MTNKELQDFLKRYHPDTPILLAGPSGAAGDLDERDIEVHGFDVKLSPLGPTYVLKDGWSAIVIWCA